MLNEMSLKLRRIQSVQMPNAAGLLQALRGLVNFVCTSLFLATLILTPLTFILAPTPVAQAASKAPVRGPSGMVASTSEIASQVGADILRQGGNAVDAAIAVGFALAVVWPEAGNLGGGGFMLLRKSDGTSEVIDYRERAPLAATRDMYLSSKGEVIDGLSTDTYKGVGVPGTVAGFELAHKRHGKLSWAKLVEPAYRLALEGFKQSHLFVERTKDVAERLSRFPETKRVILSQLREGALLKQKDLAATLARIRAKGTNDFYHGTTARLLIKDIAANEGILTLKDLETYEPTIRQPLRGTYRGHEILTMPPPSSGGAVLLEMLNMLETFDLTKVSSGSSAHLHLLTEVMLRGFADRSAYMGDTDFVKVPIQGIVTKEYARERVKGISLDGKATTSANVKAGAPQKYESPQTTHFTVIDKDGSIVSNTYTLNDSYGCGAIAAGTGIVLNNEMDDFTSKPGAPNLFGLIQGEANSIAPKKRPLSSMTPTIVLKDGKPEFALGSPGGPTIINTVLQIIVNVIDFKMNLQEAVDAPRIHHQWMPDKINWEPNGLNSDTRAILEKRGHVFSDTARRIGDAHVVGVEAATGVRLGASDTRAGGVAVAN